MRQSLIVVMLLVSYAHVARAAPGSLSFAGRLSNSTGPVDGQVTVTFSIFPTATVGAAAWSDTISLTADHGLVFATLGRTANPLDETVFTGSQMFLELVVGGETLAPRLPINSTPYAIRSSSADTSDRLGALGPGDVQIRVTGTCNPGSSIQSISTSGTVTCEADDNTTYTALNNGGVTINGSNQVALTTCAAGQLLKAGAGGVWACGVDSDTTYTALNNGGVTINGSNQVALTTCTSGQVLKAGAGGAWACAADANSGGTVTGITTGTGSGLLGGCSAGTCTLSVKTSDFVATPATTYSTAFVDVDAAAGQTLAQVTINAPTAGTILVIATGDLFCVGCASTSDAGTISLFIASSATGAEASNSVLRVPGSAPGATNTPVSSASNHRVFRVAAGANTFFFRGQLVTGSPTMRVLHAHISAIFTPQ